MEVEDLTFFCGKMGAGKSTMAKSIAQNNRAVLLSEDDWLCSLYPKSISSVEDYVEYSGRIKPLVKNLVQNIILAGSNVVMDFPANTVIQRNWFRSIFSEIGAGHKLIYIDLPNDMCLKRIAKRRLECPERAQTDNEEMFNQVTRYFSEPKPEENINIVKVQKSA